MRGFHWLHQFILRVRYPISLPQDIASDLGISTPNFLSFEEFVAKLTNPYSRPQKVARFMPREVAEAAFQNAQRKEKFSRNSLYSYYLYEGWLEFSLYFDEQSRLRRIYIQHKRLPSEQGLEIPLNQCTNPSDSSAPFVEVI